MVKNEQNAHRGPCIIKICFNRLFFFALLSSCTYIFYFSMSVFNALI